MTAMPGRRLRHVLLAAMAAMVPVSSAAQEAGYDRLDEATKAGIKSACHGWIYEDAANRLAGLLDAVSPLCDRREQDRLRGRPGPAGADASPPRPYLGPDYVPTDFGRRSDPAFSIRVECDHEYMCIRMRKKAQDAGRPVTMEEYGRVSVHCEGEYGCIERFFAPLPDIAIPATPPAEPAAAPEAAAIPAAPPGPGSLFDGNLTLTGRIPATLQVEARYANRSGVPVSLGPVELDMRCADGSTGRAWSGGSAWLLPGEERTVRVSGEGAIRGQSCPGGIAGYRPTGLVRHLQAGIGGYDEQYASCPDGRKIPVLIRMADASGQAYEIFTGDGRTVGIHFRDYDARLTLGEVCGTDPVAGDRREFVGGATAYLSRDYHAFMEAWSRNCASLGTGCAEAYGRWAAARPE
jgi:hypothetical protein